MSSILEPVAESCHPAMKNVSVKLSNKHLWEQFHGQNNEMIITKTGRRMFPSLQLNISGLEPDARYFVMLEMTLCSGHRFKYCNSEWLPVGKAEPQLSPQTRLAVHPDSPAVGSYWNSQPVLFQKIRLTNNTMDQTGNIILTSMHKYLPRILIVKASDILAAPWSPTIAFTFKETEFTAVTAYQNDAITKLKIDNNPFAKGFRETGQSKTKRKTKSSSSFDEPDAKRRDLDLMNSTTNADDSGISSISSTPPPEIEDEDEYIDVIGTDEEEIKESKESRKEPTHNEEEPKPFLPRSYWSFPTYFPYPYPLPYYPCPPAFDPLNKENYLRSVDRSIPPMFSSLPYVFPFEKHFRPLNTVLPLSPYSHVDYQSQFPLSCVESNLIDLRTKTKCTSDSV